MKNLTRILALVLVFTMMVSSAAFAAKFTDVAEDSKYAEAVEVLSALGILNGYEDGTFKPDAVITRAEVVAVVNRLQGLSDAAKAAAGTSMYTDVATTDWFAGDVNLASQMGIVSGDGNGLFRPNDQVKYEEAVKMMVAALGYNHEYVMKQGGWPTGYLVIATDKGVTKGLAVSAGEPAHRGIVAKLAYQSLTAPMMVLGSYDDEGKATYVSDVTKTLLGTKLGFAKLVGYVSANANSSLDSATGTNDTEVVKYTVDTTARTGKNDSGYKYFVGNTDVADYASNNKKAVDDLQVNGTDVAKTLGYATEVYVGSNEKGEPEVLTYVVAKKNNYEVVIENVEDIQKIGSGAKDSTIAASAAGLNGDYSVYDDETDATNTTYTLEDAQIIFNGQYIAATNFDKDIISATELGKFFAPAQGTVKLLDNDGNGKYDYVFVTSYETKVVDYVYSANTRIALKAGASIDLSNYIEKADEGYELSIKLDGEEIEIADLQEYDVLSVATAGKKTEILVSRKVVEGSVEAVEGNLNKAGATATDRRDSIITVAGNEYVVANLADTSELAKISSRSEGKFYIDAFGKIAFFEGTAATLKGNLAFLTRAGKTKAYETDVYEVELMNKDGSIVSYELADNVRVDDAASTTAAATVYTAIDNLVNKAGKTTLEFAARVVTYKANASGKITAINFAKKTAKGEGLEYVDVAKDDKLVETTQTFDSSTNSFDKVVVNDSTVVFYVPTAKTLDDYNVTSTNMFKDNKKYKLTFLDIVDGVANVAIVSEGAASVSDESALAIVTGSRDTIDEDGNDVVSVTFLQAGEEKTLIVDPESVKTSALTTADFAKGVVFEYGVNAKDYIDDIKFVATFNDKTLAGDIKVSYSTDRVANSDFCYVAGWVVSKSGSTIGIAASATTDADNLINIDGVKNVYAIDATATRIKPVLSSIGDITKTIQLKDSLGNITGVDSVDGDEITTYVLIKYVEKTIVDIVVVNGLNH